MIKIETMISWKIRQLPLATQSVTVSYSHAMFGEKMGNQVEPSVELHVTLPRSQGTPHETPRETPNGNPCRTAEIQICVTPQEELEKNL